MKGICRAAGYAPRHVPPPEARKPIPHQPGRVAHRPGLTVAAAGHGADLDLPIRASLHPVRARA